MTNPKAKTNEELIESVDYLLEEVLFIYDVKKREAVIEWIKKEREGILDKLSLEKKSCEFCDGSVIKDCGCGQWNKFVDELNALKEKVREGR